MNDTVNRKYILILAALAAAVLAVGTLLKPKKLAPEPPSPTETASLRARYRREELGETAAYFAQRAQALAKDVIYDAAHDSSAVAWGKAGQVLTTSAVASESFDPPLILTAGKAGKPPSARLTDQDTGRWVLIVGRTPDAQLLWTPAVYGGARQTACAGEIYSELIVNARLDSALSGAGAFDLDGEFVGIVANCDGSYHLVSAASIPSLLKAFAAPDRKIESAYGLHAAPLNAAAKRLFAVDSGLFVSEVRQGAGADQAGLRAGDVITAVKGQPLTDSRELWRALASGDENARSLEVLRGRRKAAVRMPSLDDARGSTAGAASLGIRIIPTARPADSLYVAPGSPAYKAGLRSGDQLIQIGARRTSAAADLARTISEMGDKPLLVVCLRNGAQNAFLVSK